MNKNNFLAALKGDAAAVNGPVLGSDDQSTVFLFISAPSSAPGQIDFPSGDPLTKAELMDALTYMHENKKYKEILIYLATDYAASMLEDIPENTKVFAMTATDASSVQNFANCPPDDIELGTAVGACMATEFGQTWMK